MNVSYISPFKRKLFAKLFSKQTIETKSWLVETFVNKLITLKVISLQAI